MSTIFISHSSNDNSLAQLVKEKLEKKGHYSIFLDFDPTLGINAGSSWEQTLYRKLRSCQAVIVIVTKDYLSSKWCFAELALARMEGKYINTLIFDENLDNSELNYILLDRQIIDMSNSEEEGWQRLYKGLESAQILGVEGEWKANQCPYLGLLSYKEKDAPVFFGRNDEIRMGLELLSRGAPNTAMVVGASGSGKSSLVMAGILPKLRALSNEWIIIDQFQPRYDPFLEISISLESTFKQYNSDDYSKIMNAESIQEKLESDVYLANASNYSYEKNSSSPTALNKILDKITHQSAEIRNTKVLIVIDQFEEFFINFNSNDKMNSFVRILSNSLIFDQKKLFLLFTMRSDFLGVYQKNKTLQRLDYEVLSLGPMQKENMRKVIETPARLGAVSLEMGLADRLLEDSEDALPLLSFTLRKLWEDYGDDKKLKIHEYEQLGGIKGAISNEASAILKRAFADDKQEALKNVFLQMVSVTHDGKYVRKPVRKTIPEVVIVDKYINEFIAKRLLTTYINNDEVMIEVSHESLFDSWPSLKKWLNDNHSELLFLQQLQQDANTWIVNKRDPEDLWSGLKLQRAQEIFIKLHDPAIIEFVDSSQLLVNKKRLKNRISILIFSVIVISLVVSVLLFYLRYVKHIKESEMLSKAISMKEIDPTMSLHLATYLEKNATYKDSFFESDILSLKNGILNCYDKTHFYSKIFPRHNGYVLSLDFSRDGTKILSAGLGSKVFLWNTDGALVNEFDIKRSQVGCARFSPKGDYIIAIDYKGTVTIVDLAGSVKHKFELGGLGNYDIQFSPNGDFVVAYSRKHAYLFRPNSDREAKKFNLPGNSYSTPIFRKIYISKDGASILSIHDNNRAFLWNDEASLLKIIDNKSLDFANYKNMWIGLKSNGSPYIIDSKGQMSENDFQFKGPNSTFRNITTSPNGDKILTYDFDNQIFLHDLNGNLINSFKGIEHHNDGLLFKKGENLSFSPSGNYLYDISESKQVLVWNTKGELISTFYSPKPGGSLALVFSLDDKLIASSQHTTFVLRDLATKESELNLDEAERDTIRANYLSENMSLTEEIAKYFDPGKLNGYLNNWNICE
ncbi:nSTAND1 domain-containing NTPase [Portibacter marinus]|uniref:nSTAND1 domain-containing NTPase n=1 Tax=Portibacter marinus TaxID=2898660 RepID=UPI001F3376BB|nr:TIR domain-containing protein [Portibacter marinus]